MTIHPVENSVAIRTHRRQIFNTAPNLTVEFAKGSQMMSFGEISPQRSVKILKLESAHLTRIPPFLIDTASNFEAKPGGK